MTGLLELKEKFVRFYGKFEIYITPVVRFAVALTAFMMINHTIGYMKSLDRTPVALILALICAVMPVNVTLVLAAILILVHLYALALEVCLVAFLLFAILFLLYFRFSPKDGYGTVLTTISFVLRVPYAMPLGMGLLREIYSVLSLACGTVIYFFLKGVRVNQALLSEAAEDTDNSKIVIVLNQLLDNKEMFLVLGIMAITLVLVNIIRRLSVENAWTIAIVSGVLFQTIGLIAGYMLLGISGKTVELLVGNVIGCAVAFILQFLFFHLDYSRTERLQFEDDDYYYYVKAVPKVCVSGREKKVKRFSGRNQDVERLTRKQFAEEMDIDEDLLD
jgi:hypothetical protein